MYEQDVIFGPLSFKQFIVLAIGFGLSYLLHKQIPQYESLQAYIYIIIAFIAILSLYVAFSFFKNKIIPIEKIEEYFKKMKLHMSPQEYYIMLARKSAMIQSQIAVRRDKGLSVDNSLDPVLEIVNTLLQEAKNPNIQ